MTVSAEQEGTRYGGSKPQPGMSGKAAAVGYGRKFCDLHLGTGQATAQALQNEVAHHGLRRILASAGVTGCEVGRAALPNLGRTGEVVLFRQSDGMIERYNSQAACAHDS